MISSLISRLEHTTFTLTGFILGFSALIFVRFFLEALSSPTVSRNLSIDPTTLIHYALFYLATYLTLALIIGFFTRNYRAASALLLFCFLVIWLPPAFDLISSGGIGRTMAYLFAEPPQLLSRFLTFFGPLNAYGITLGIRIEIALALVFVTGYVYRVRRNVLLALAAALTSYLALFFLVALPSSIYALSLALGGDTATIIAFLDSALMTSGTVINALTGTVVPATPVIAFEVGFNKLMSLIFIPLIILLATVLCYKLDSRVVLAHVRNARPERLAHYIFLVLFGAFLGMAGRTGYAWPDALGLLSLVIAFAAAWMHAVAVNDLEDEAIDSVSNTKRPLITNVISRSHMKESAFAFLVLSLLAAWTAGYHSLFFLCAFIACYYVYSAAPLRLKRVPALSSLLIACAAASALLAGLFFSVPEKIFDAIPMTAVLGVVVCYALAVHMRDLKDIDGDVVGNVRTVAVLLHKRFGLRVAHHAIGALVALSFFLSPFFFPIPYLWLVAVPAGVLGYVACSVLPYKEYRVFCVYFAYLLFAAVLLFV